MGHPMMENGIAEAKPLQIGQSHTKKLGVFLGSRQGELKRTAPEILAAIPEIQKAYPDKVIKVELGTDSILEDIDTPERYQDILSKI